MPQRVIYIFFQLAKTAATVFQCRLPSFWTKLNLAFLSCSWSGSEVQVPLGVDRVYNPARSHGMGGKLERKEEFLKQNKAKLKSVQIYCLCACMSNLWPQVKKEPSSPACLALHSTHKLAWAFCVGQMNTISFQMCSVLHVYADSLLLSLTDSFCLVACFSITLWLNIATVFRFLFLSSGNMLQKQYVRTPWADLSSSPWVLPSAFLPPDPVVDFGTQNADLALLAGYRSAALICTLLANDLLSFYGESRHCKRKLSIFPSTTMQVLEFLCSVSILSKAL